MRPILIINSNDRNHASENLIKELYQILSSRLEKYKIVHSYKFDDTPQIINEAKEDDYDTIIAGGGDGTLNSIVNQMPLDRFALSTLPLGTANCFAQSAGLSNDPRQALLQLIEGKTKKISVGTLNHLRFLCFCSIGFDASAVHKCNLQLKRLIRKMAYVFSGLEVFSTLKGVDPFHIRGDFELPHTHSIMISQIKHYAGFNLFPEAEPEHDKLRACIIRTKSRLDILRLMALWYFYARGTSTPPSIRLRQFKQIIIESKHKLKIQIDGEPIQLDQSKTLDIKTTPNALTCLLPS